MKINAVPKHLKYQIVFLYFSYIAREKYFTNIEKISIFVE